MNKQNLISKNLCKLNNTSKLNNTCKLNNTSKFNFIIKKDINHIYKYTAFIIEPRKHNAFEFVLNNFIDNSLLIQLYLKT